MTVGMDYLLKILRGCIKHFRLIPCARKLGQGNHRKILIGGGIRKYLQIFIFNLFVPTESCVEVYDGERLFRGIWGKAFRTVGNGNFYGGDLAVTIREPHCNGSTVRGCDSDSNILQWDECVACVSMNGYVSSG